MQQHWLVTLQNLAATGRQWDTDVPRVLLADKEVGSVQALSDVICSESCQGLCQGCGVNLNIDSCRCKQDDREHPFAALRGLSLDS